MSLTFSISTTETMSREDLLFSSRSWKGAIRLGEGGEGMWNTLDGTRPRRALRMSRLISKSMV